MKHDYLRGSAVAAAHDLEEVVEVAKVIDDHIGATKFAVLRKFVRAVDHVRADIPELAHSGKDGNRPTSTGDGADHVANSLGHAIAREDLRRNDGYPGQRRTL